MIHYRDMTFCPFYENCARQTGCVRALTPEVRADANTWWGDKSGHGAPISRYSNRPDCHVLVGAQANETVTDRSGSDL